MTLPMPILRRALLELGRRLAEAGILEAAEDVFHLRFDELEHRRGLASTSRHRRRAAQGSAAARGSTPRAGTGRHTTHGSAFADRAATWRRRPRRRHAGQSGCGRGTGAHRARSRGLRVTAPRRGAGRPYTNPSWTPLFTRAAAVVVDTGAAMSHAAIVAREYGVPAVMGTGDGTRRLSDGQWVRVDGGRGQVFAASAPGEDAPSRVAIDADSENQDGSGGNRLPERGDPIEVQRVRYKTEQEDPENRAGHPTPAAAE